MSAFSREWLALREPADRAARSAVLLERLRHELRRHATAAAARAASALSWPGASTSPAAPPIFDFGAGSGANLRFTAPLLGGAQTWTLLDNDPALLATAPQMIAQWAEHEGLRTNARAAARVPHARIEIAAPSFQARVLRRLCNLAAPGALDWPPGAIVTASALLDLVSAEWLGALGARCLARGSPVAFALSYDGRMELTPAEPEDDEVRTLVNRHQRTDKGFGPALGPAAAARAPQVFASLGYECATARSDWRLAPSAAALQVELLEGWRQAASEIEPARAAALALWHSRRLGHVALGRSEIVVGHVDLVAWLPERSARPSD